MLLQIYDFDIKIAFPWIKRFVSFLIFGWTQQNAFVTIILQVTFPWVVGGRKGGQLRASDGEERGKNEWEYMYMGVNRFWKGIIIFVLIMNQIWRH